MIRMATEHIGTHTHKFCLTQTHKHKESTKECNTTPRFRSFYQHEITSQKWTPSEAMDFNGPPWNVGNFSGHPREPSREAGLLALGVCRGVSIDAIGVNAAGADFIGPTWEC